MIAVILDESSMCFATHPHAPPIQLAVPFSVWYPPGSWEEAVGPKDQGPPPRLPPQQQRARVQGQVRVRVRPQ